MISGVTIHHLLSLLRACPSRRFFYSSSSLSNTSRGISLFNLRNTTTTTTTTKSLKNHLEHANNKTLKNSRFHCTSPLLGLSLKPPISLIPRLFSSISAENDERENITQEHPLQYETSKGGEINGWEDEDDVETDGWEEEEDVEPKIGDGGDGGGVVLQGIPWGERALSIAHEVLLQFGDDMKLYALKTTPRGYIYVRLDKLSNEYGCPSMEELENFCQEYKKRLDEVGAFGEIPDNLALEVSSPSAERILKVPDDLNRFKDMPMTVCYLESLESNCPERNGVFFLESIEMESENCVWKLADVKENRDPESKGRPLSRKRRDWRLKLPFQMHRRVTLYIEF